MSREGKMGSATVLTDEQLKIVLKTVLGRGNTHSYRNHSIIILSHLCGLRAQELASLKVSDVWIAGKVVDTLRLIGSYTKGNKHRDIPLTNRKVVDAIEKHLTNEMEMHGRFLEPSGPLFKSQKGRFFSPNSIVHLIKRIYEDAGIRNASSHSGRKKFAITLIEQGADINCVKLLMGHSSIQTTALYCSPSPRRLANLMSSMQM